MRRLPDRIAKLNACMGRLHEPRDKPLLLTRDWIEEASRVKRRVVAQGGSDHSFFDEVREAIYASKSVESGTLRVLESNIRNRFLLHDETFTFHIMIHRPARASGPDY
jgi:hypothetical protein